MCALKFTLLSNIIPKYFTYVNDKYCKPVNIYFCVEVICSSFAEAYVGSYCFRELEAIFIGPFLYFVKAVLHLSFKCRHVW